MKKFYIFILLIIPFTLSCKVITWTDNNAQNSSYIGKSILLYKDSTNSKTIEEIANSSFQHNFYENDNDIINFGFNDQIYWLRIDYLNDTDDELVLRIAQFNLEICEFFYKEQNTWKSSNGGFHVNIIDRQFNDHHQVYPLQKGSHTVYLRVLSYTPPLPIQIMEKTDYIADTAHMKIVIGLYIGIFAFVILYNLFLFFALRRPAYFYYSILVILNLCLTAIVMDGFIMYYFDDINYKWLYHFLPMIAQVVTLLYGLIFLEIRKYVPHKIKVVYAIGIYFISFLVIDLFLPFQIIIIKNQINALIVLFSIGYIGYLALKRGNKVAIYYSAAYFIYLIIVIFEIIYINYGYPDYILGLSYPAIAFFLEVLILSYALTKRFQWERKANIETILEAKTQLIEKTQENERIVKEQNIILEKRVNERTIELNKTNNLLYNTLKTVEQEKSKSDALLLNILPKSTAEELKENGFAQPRDFKNVSILFTDFIDFTSTTNSLSPTRLVEDLNECFKAFDSIVKKLNLEKIKTIGDAYMAASGLPDEHNDHAIVAVRCAMQMMDFIRAWQKKRLDHGHEIWKIRMGIHSGPVVAGVVGDHKFAYDIWGDAVNTASRMESNSNEGKINISAATYELVKDHFQCTPRGKFFVKGKGEMEMFWVEKEFQLV